MLPLTVEVTARIAHSLRREFAAATGEPDLPAWDALPPADQALAVADARQHLERDIAASASASARDRAKHDLFAGAVRALRTLQPAPPKPPASSDAIPAP